MRQRKPPLTETFFPAGRLFFALKIPPLQVFVFPTITKAKNYKAFVSKYKAHILKYVPCIFCAFRM